MRGPLRILHLAEFELTFALALPTALPVKRLRELYDVSCY